MPGQSNSICNYIPSLYILYNLLWENQGTFPPPKYSKPSEAEENWDKNWNLNTITGTKYFSSSTSKPEYKGQMNPTLIKLMLEFLFSGPALIPYNADLLKNIQPFANPPRLGCIPDPKWDSAPFLQELIKGDASKNPYARMLGWRICNVPRLKKLFLHHYVHNNTGTLPNAAMLAGANDLYNQGARITHANQIIPIFAATCLATFRRDNTAFTDETGEPIPWRKIQLMSFCVFIEINKRLNYYHWYQTKNLHDFKKISIHGLRTHNVSANLKILMEILILVGSWSPYNSTGTPTTSKTPNIMGQYVGHLFGGDPTASSYKNIQNTIKQIIPIKGVKKTWQQVIDRYTETLCVPEFICNACLNVCEINEAVCQNLKIHSGRGPSGEGQYKFYTKTPDAAGQPQAPQGTTLTWKQVCQRQFHKLSIVNNTFAIMNPYALIKNKIRENSTPKIITFGPEALQYYQELLKPITINAPMAWLPDLRDATGTIVPKPAEWETGIPTIKMPTSTATKGLKENPYYMDFQRFTVNSALCTWQIPPSEIHITKDSPALDPVNIASPGKTAQIFTSCSQGAQWKNGCGDFKFAANNFGMVNGVLGLNNTGIPGAGGEYANPWIPVGAVRSPNNYSPSCLNDPNYGDPRSGPHKISPVDPPHDKSSHWQAATDPKYGPMPSCSYVGDPNLSYNDPILVNYKMDSSGNVSTDDGKDLCMGATGTYFKTSTGDPSNPNAPYKFNGTVPGCQGPAEKGGDPGKPHGDSCLYAYSDDGIYSGAPYCRLPEGNKTFPNGIPSLLPKKPASNAFAKDVGYFCCTGTSGRSSAQFGSKCLDLDGKPSTECRLHTDSKECILAAGCNWLGSRPFTDKATSSSSPSPSPAEWSNFPSKLYSNLSPPNPWARMNYANMIITQPGRFKTYYNNNSPIMITYPGGSWGALLDWALSPRIGVGSGARAFWVTRSSEDSDTGFLPELPPRLETIRVPPAQKGPYCCNHKTDSERNKCESVAPLTPCTIRVGESQMDSDSRGPWPTYEQCQRRCKNNYECVLASKSEYEPEIADCLPTFKDVIQQNEYGGDTIGDVMDSWGRCQESCAVHSWAQPGDPAGTENDGWAIDKTLDEQSLVNWEVGIVTAGPPPAPPSPWPWPSPTPPNPDQLSGPNNLESASYDPEDRNIAFSGGGLTPSGDESDDFGNIDLLDNMPPPVDEGLKTASPPPPPLNPSNNAFYDPEILTEDTVNQLKSCILADDSNSQSRLFEVPGLNFWTPAAKNCALKTTENNCNHPPPGQADCIWDASSITPSCKEKVAMTSYIGQENTCGTEGLKFLNTLRESLRQTRKNNEKDEL